MNSLNAVRISFFVLVILFFSEVANENIAKAQDGSGKATTTTKSKTKPKAAKTVEKSTKTITIKPKSKKIPDPPLGDWEINNMIGRWEGLHNQGSSTMFIERFEDYTFYGYFIKGEFKIAFTGVIDKNRKIVVTETEVLSNPANYGWNLGVWTGKLPYACLRMEGTGKGGNTVYTWSYVKIIG